MGAGGKRTKKPSDDGVNDESGVDVDGGDIAAVESLELSEAALNGDKEGVVEEDDAAAVRGDDFDSMPRAFIATGSMLPDLSFITDAAVLTSTTLPTCFGEASPTAAASALSPIDDVPSYDDAGGTLTFLDESSRSHLINTEERDVQSVMCDAHE
jgi:hypothetical protein